MIYHITSRAAWEQAQQKGQYIHESLAKEGFIHCSNGDQLEDTANRYFKTEPSIFILAIDPSRVTSEIKVEESPHGWYPHIYGPLPVQAVLGGMEINRSPDGMFHMNTR